LGDIELQQARIAAHLPQFQQRIEGCT
jgi:hypothetical protein